MRTPKAILDFVRWRWAPTVGLSLGAIVYVALAVVLIPERIGDTAGLGSRPMRTPSLAARITTGSEDTPTTVADVTPARPAVDLTPTPTQVDLQARRGFSPPLPRPEPLEIPPPAPMPEQAPPPMPEQAPPPIPEQAPPPPPMPTPTMDVMAPPVPTNLPQGDPNAATAAPQPVPGPDPNAMPPAPDPNLPSSSLPAPVMPR